MSTTKMVLVGAGVAAAAAVAYYLYKRSSGGESPAAAPAEAAAEDAEVARHDSKKGKRPRKRTSRKSRREDGESTPAAEAPAASGGGDESVSLETITTFLNRLRGSAFDAMYQLQLHAARFMQEHPDEDQQRVQSMVMQQFVQLLSAAESSLLQELDVSQEALQKAIDGNEDPEVRRLHSKFMKVVRGDLEEEVRELKAMTEEQLGMSKETAAEVMEEVMAGTMRAKTEVFERMAASHGIPATQLESKVQEDPKLVQELQQDMQRTIVALQRKITEDHGSTITQFDLAVRAYKMQDSEFVKAIASLQRRLVES